MKNTKQAGFTSVFIVIIFSSVMALMAMFITLSLDRAADSIATVVTSNAASSVLSECNKSLHDQFGVMAFKDDVCRLSKLADYYINESIDGKNRFVHLKLNAVIINTGDNSDLHKDDFRSQLAALGKKGLVFKSKRTKHLNSFIGSSLPSYRASKISLLDPQAVLSAMESRYRPGENLFITQYVCSNLSIAEREYLLFGKTDIESNANSTRNTIFAIRCIIDCVEEIEDPILWIEAIMRAWEEAEAIMQNEYELEKYLKAMCFVMSGSDRFTYRIMDVMQLAVGNGFNFKNYAYSFEITAQYTRNSKSGAFTQRHSYTKE